MNFLKNEKIQIDMNSLKAKEIDDISQLVSDFLSEHSRTDKKEILRLRLSIEEALLCWQKQLGENTRVSLVTSRRFTRPIIELRVRGKRVNPYEHNEESLPGTSGSHNLISFYGLEPSYSYNDNENILSLTPSAKKMSSVMELMLAIVLSVIAAFACRVLPEAVGSFITASVVQPLMNTFSGFLSAAAGPMVFLSVVWSIFAIGDITTLSKLGKKVIGGIHGMGILLETFVVLVSFGFFELNYSGSTGTLAQLEQILKIFLDMIPSNMLRPFIEGNVLQLIFMALVFGVAMLLLQEKIPVFAGVVEQANFIIQTVVSGISKFLPFFIFLCLFNTLMDDVGGLAASFGKVVLLMVTVPLLIQILMTAYVCIRKRVSPLVLLKKEFPALVVSLTTASSVAAYGPNMDICPNRLGVDKQIVDFSLPIYQVFFKPGAAAELGVVVLAMAEIYDVPVSVDWLVMVVIMSMLIAIATIPVAGAFIGNVTILFAQMGIPAEAIGISITLITLADFVCSMVTVSTQHMQLILTADSMDMLDREKLRK